MFAKYQHLNFDNNKNGYFQPHRKTTKSTFFPSVFFIEIFVTTTEVNIPSKLQSQSQLSSEFVCSYLLLGLSYSLCLVHTDLALIFNITTALHAGKQPQFLSAFVSFPTYCIFILQPTTQILRLLCSSVVKTSKICIHPESSPKATGTLFCGGHFSRSTSNGPNSSMKYDVYLTCFIEKVDSELHVPSSLLMLIRQLLKMKNGCELTKNRRNTKFQSLLQVNKLKW